MEIPLITSPLLRGIDRLIHGFTTRDGGVSSGPFATLNLGLATGDDDDAVEENYCRLSATLQISPDRILGIHQIHGREVVRVESGVDPGELRLREGDAMITQERGAILSVRVADCLPILLADPKRGVTAVVHAGWRGTLENVVGVTVASLTKDYGAQPGDLVAAIGPGISAGAFEVGAGVAALFEARMGLGEGEIVGPPDQPHLDLARINLRQALEAGMARDRISMAEGCTYGDARRFFSYRRDGKKSGRMLGFIGFVA